MTVEILLGIVAFIGTMGTGVLAFVWTELRTLRTSIGKLADVLSSLRERVAALEAVAKVAQ